MVKRSLEIMSELDTGMERNVGRETKLQESDKGVKQ